MGSDFEIHRDDGSKRDVVIGDDWEAFDQTMRFYEPDDEIRQGLYDRLLKSLVNGGHFKKSTVTVYASNDINLDLSDERLAAELASNPEEGA